jgi:excisionase family DNA binding protein
VSAHLLTARDVAGELAVSSETILRWTRAGELPAIRLPGGAIRFRREELDAWLEARSTDAADRELSDARANRARRGAGYSSVDRLSFGPSDARPLEAATTEEEDHAR